MGLDDLSGLRSIRSAIDPPACPDGFDPAPRDIENCTGAACTDPTQHVCKFGTTGGVEGMCGCVGG